MNTYTDPTTATTTMLTKDEVADLIRERFATMKDSFVEDPGGFLSQVIPFDMDATDEDAALAISEVLLEWESQE